MFTTLSFGFLLLGWQLSDCDLLSCQSNSLLLSYEKRGILYFSDETKKLTKCRLAQFISCELLYMFKIEKNNTKLYTCKIVIFQRNEICENQKKFRTHVAIENHKKSLSNVCRNFYSKSNSPNHYTSILPLEKFLHVERARGKLLEIWNSCRGFTAKTVNERRDFRKALRKIFSIVRS